MTTAVKKVTNTQVNDFCKPLLDHLASELAKEYVRLIKQSANAEQNNDNTEINTCVLPFTPVIAQKVNVKRA